MGPFSVTLWVRLFLQAEFPMARDEQRVVCASDFEVIETWAVGAF